MDRKKLRFTRSSIEPVCVRPPSRNPCLANGYESLAHTLAAFGALAAIHFGLRRLARFESGADLTRGAVTCFPDGRSPPDCGAAATRAMGHKAVKAAMRPLRQNRSFIDRSNAFTRPNALFFQS